MMAGTSTVEVKCVKCGRIYETEAIDHIDLSQDRDLYRRIQRGKINRAQCPKCRKVMYLDRSVVINFEPLDLIVVYDQTAKSASARKEIEHQFRNVTSFNEVLEEIGNEVEFEVISDLKKLKKLMKDYTKTYG
ncbi:hypothetical protein EU538_04125 [Candidatus Thorarchaeota archaeon]|jgi:hypothetical protein|nr:MAG: hypothetical protein EU538_04125 [Candidatus Thorarchaeota archaeon]